MEATRNRVEFDEFCREAFGSNSQSSVLTQAKIEEIISFLKDPQALQWSGSNKSKFRWWVKSKGFVIMNCAALQVENALCVPPKVCSTFGSYICELTYLNISK